MTDHQRPSPLETVHLYARGAAIVLAAVPSTCFVPLPVTQLFTSRFDREDRLKRLHFMRSWARFCRRWILDIDLDVEGREHLPSPSKGHMYISNHQSYSDIIVLIEALDTVGFLSKRVPVKYIPLIGRSAYCAGTVFIDRGSKESREAALQETLRMCEESVAVVVFPEGTRSEDGELRERIYPRAMQAARGRGLRLVPVGLHGTWRVIPKSMDRVGLDQPVAVRIGPALDPADFDTDESYAEACWSEVTRLHAEAREAVQGKRQER